MIAGVIAVLLIIPLEVPFYLEKYLLKVAGAVVRITWHVFTVFGGEAGEKQPNTPLMLKPNSQQKREGTNGKFQKINFTNWRSRRADTAGHRRRTKLLQGTAGMERIATTALTGRTQPKAMSKETWSRAAGGVIELNAI